MVPIKYTRCQRLTDSMHVSTNREVFLSQFAQTKQMMEQDSTNDAEKRPQFGTRTLSNQDDVYQHNAWDNVEWDDDFKREVITKIEQNSASPMSEQQIETLQANADEYWNQFYLIHTNKFFKDRHWLFTEFPELLPSSEAKNILELGCGVGNTIFPLLETDTNKSLFVYACDFSEKAIDLVQTNSAYDPSRCCAFKLDITGDWAGSPLQPNSIDVCTMIFVLSAIDPNHHVHVIDSVRKYLKPNGIILFRDYGYLDLAQVRFKKGRFIKNNFYARGDGTRSYFFTESEVANLFENAGLNKMSLYTDRRLQINRANKKKMYRIWIQAKYMKSK